jgi:hypothetical protein
MSNPYRAMIAQLAAALQQQVFLDPEIDGNHLPHLAEALLAQPEPPDLTDDELLEIRDGAYCPSVDDVNDEEDSMWQYTSDYISWLHDQGTIEEQQEYEAKGLRAVFNAGRRARCHPQQSATMPASTGEA